MDLSGRYRGKRKLPETASGQRQPWQLTFVQGLPPNSSLCLEPLEMVHFDRWVDSLLSLTLEAGDVLVSLYSAHLACTEPCTDPQY